MPHFFAPISKELDGLEKNLVHYLKTPNIAINQVLAHIFESGGKRIRPALFLLCCQLLEEKGPHVQPMAAVCEYIHTASLLHDDVIDNSTLRRGKPTANSIWGDETAVLVGDLIYSTACRLMVKTRSLDLIDTFAECIRIMSESELFQLDLLWKMDTTQEDCFRVIQGKTAQLFEASSKTPCYLNNANEKILSHMSHFGKNIGFAFQIADDCLDYTSVAQHLGKPILQDLVEGKITLPLLYTLENHKEQTLSLITKILESPLSSQENILTLKDLVISSGALAKVEARANQFISSALTSLNTVVETLGKLNHIQEQAFLALQELAHFALIRKT